MQGFDAVEGAHRFHALLEFDVTELKAWLQASRRAAGGGSFYAYFLKAVALTIRSHPDLGAMVDYSKTTWFGSVDLNIPVEVSDTNGRAPRNIVLRDVANRSVADISTQIERAKTEAAPAGFVESPLVRRLMGALPRFLARFLFRRILSRHGWVRELAGTHFVTSVVGIANGPGFFLPYAGGPNAVSFVLGGTCRKPWVVGDRIEIREIASVTASFNHDLIDGAPAARCGTTLRRLLEDPRSFATVLDAPHG